MAVEQMCVKVIAAIKQADECIHSGLYGGRHCRSEAMRLD
jgi:hypothetical protein